MVLSLTPELLVIFSKICIFNSSIIHNLIIICIIDAGVLGNLPYIVCSLIYITYLHLFHLYNIGLFNASFSYLCKILYLHKGHYFIIGINTPSKFFFQYSLTVFIFIFYLISSSFKFSIFTLFLL